MERVKMEIDKNAVIALSRENLIFVATSLDLLFQDTEGYFAHENHDGMRLPTKDGLDVWEYALDEIISLEDSFGGVEELRDGFPELVDTLVDISVLNELHKEVIFNLYNTIINVWTDGSISTMGQNISFQDRDVYKDILFQEKASGSANIDTGYYTAGWIVSEKENEKTGEMEYYTDDNRVLSFDEMISECIEEGDHSEWYSELAEKHYFRIIY